MSADSINDGGPAFPGVQYAPGMTLRDYFAAKAMQAIAQEIVSSAKTMSNAQANIPLIAPAAYRIADAMLKARQS